MQLHLLGHVHFTRDGRNVVVSSKSAALLTYLVLERQAHHREHLAELLWDTADPLRNLRVELARLKRDGVTTFPERQPMLHFACLTDLDPWTEAAPQVDDAHLLGWLATLRGLPLSGLEDLGTRAYQQWLEGQRWNIIERVEQTLGRVRRRLSAQHHAGAAAQILARADRLGLRLPDEPAPPDPPGPDPPEWRCVWDEQATLGGLLGRSTRPQLVRLYGRRGSGKRSLIRQSLQGSGWVHLDLQATEVRTLFQEVLWQQLEAHLPPRQAPAADHGAGRAPDPDGSLAGLASTLRHSGLNALISVQNAVRGRAWLPDLTGFLLDLPFPLVLLLSESTPAAWEELQDLTGFADPARTHDLHMQPLTTRMALHAWQERYAHEPLTPTEREALYTQAARLIQRSDGWPLHAQALLRQRGTDGLPDGVRTALLSEIAALPRHVRQALARLSLVHAPIAPDLAGELIGPDAHAALTLGVQHGLLVPAAPEERLTVPGLHHRTQDDVRTVQFASEAMRVALAGSLTGMERQALREQLTHVHAPPPAPAAPPARPPQHPHPDLPSLARGGPGRAAPLTLTRPAPAARAAPPPDLPTFRRETRTPNGYRVALDSGHLEVMRYGWYGPPPLLRLQAGPVPDGPWTLTARLDVYRAEPDHLPGSGAHALGIGSGGAVTVYLPAEPVPQSVTQADAPANARRDAPPAALPDGALFGGFVPLGEWFTLHGHGQAGTLELTVRALDVALTVAALRWGDATVLPADA
ncbi:hypothetical protein [Deinococcus aquiradiocola]|uniref:Bacterial transcriptional activator domain-containing protein n=1 Tax=Deinococcus aquiradiocola TaxID=393059 RepID=A0A917PE23_9DEIO|nr:hypothetical protein [Deinococcus aquiradiocola]GGJ72477.1 hypothetical protein GCM10008939_16120 [Deinococcus aquiradiocola]